MMKLSGKISDRIRRGEIPDDALTGKRLPVDDRPKPESIRNGRGTALGDPTRSDRSAQTHDED